MESGQLDFAEPNCRNTRADWAHTQSDSIILFVALELKQVSVLGRNLLGRARRHALVSIKATCTNGRAALQTGHIRQNSSYHAVIY